MTASNMPALALLGNHDANDYGGDIATALTKEEQWEAIFEGLSGKWRNVIFGSTSYASPQDVPKTVEAGTGGRHMAIVHPNRPFPDIAESDCGQITP